MHLREKRFNAPFHLKLDENFCGAAQVGKINFKIILLTQINQLSKFIMNYNAMNSKFFSFALLFKWEFISRDARDDEEADTKNLRGRWVIGHHIRALCFARIEFALGEWRISAKS